MSTVPTISIIIPTYKRDALLKDCIHSILDAENPPGAYEIIVVDDGGNLQKEIESQFPGSPIRWVYLPTNSGQLSAQRTGCEMAHGDIVAFLDDDLKIDGDWITEVHRFFSGNPDMHCVVGRVKSFDSSHILARTRQQIYDARHRECEDVDYRSSIINKYNLSVCDDIQLSERICEGNFALRKQFAAEVSFFDHDLRCNVGGVMSGELLRQGYAIGYNPAMVIYHKHDTRFITLYYMARRRILSEFGKRDELRLRTSFPLWLEVFKAPFAIRKQPEMFLADPNRVKIYLVFTAIQLMFAIGALSTFLQLYTKCHLAKLKLPRAGFYRA